MTKYATQLSLDDLVIVEMRLRKSLRDTQRRVVQLETSTQACEHSVRSNQATFTDHISNYSAWSGRGRGSGSGISRRNIPSPMKATDYMEDAGDKSPYDGKQSSTLLSELSLLKQVKQEVER